MTAAIGLTGGVASGKSTVADCFSRLGVTVVDADEVARAVVERGQPAYDEIVRQFGAEVVEESGALNRAALRRRVFNDEPARRRLEAIIHPRVREALEKARRETSESYILMVVPLLVEGGLNRMMDRTLVIDVPEDVQIARLLQRDGIDHELARRMLAAQAGREQRLAVADDVFYNAGERDTIKKAVQELHKAYLTLAEHGPGSVRPLRLPASP